MPPHHDAKLRLHILPYILPIQLYLSRVVLEPLVHLSQLKVHPVTDLIGNRYSHHVMDLQVREGKEINIRVLLIKLSKRFGGSVSQRFLIYAPSIWHDLLDQFKDEVVCGKIRLSYMLYPFNNSWV